MSHSFSQSLLIGKQGEYALTKFWPNPVERTDGRKADFIDLVTGERIELKTETRDLTKTANIFLELYSDVAKGKVGGLQQALSSGSSLYVCNFSASSTAFVYEVEPLWAFIASTLANYSPVFVRNNGWVTLGIKVPRASIQHLCINEIDYSVKEPVSGAV